VQGGGAPAAATGEAPGGRPRTHSGGQGNQRTGLQAGPPPCGFTVAPSCENTVPHSTILLNIVLYCTTRYCTVLYCTTPVRSVRCCGRKPVHLGMLPQRLSSLPLGPHAQGSASAGDREGARGPPGTFFSDGIEARPSLRTESPATTVPREAENPPWASQRGAGTTMPIPSGLPARGLLWKSRVHEKRLRRQFLLCQSCTVQRALLLCTVIYCTPVYSTLSTLLSGTLHLGFSHKMCRRVNDMLLI